MVAMDMFAGNSVEAAAAGRSKRQRSSSSSSSSSRGSSSSSGSGSWEAGGSRSRGRRRASSARLVLVAALQVALLVDRTALSGAFLLAGGRAIRWQHHSSEISYSAKRPRASAPGAGGMQMLFTGGRRFPRVEGGAKLPVTAASGAPDGRSGGAVGFAEAQKQLEQAQKVGSGDSVGGGSSGSGGSGGGPLGSSSGSKGSKVDLYFDEFNFCLDKRDTALSGPSMSKALNSATNTAVKNILVLNSPSDAVHAVRDLEALRTKFEKRHGGADPKELQDAENFLDAVLSLGSPAGCLPESRLEKLVKPYNLAFRKVVGVLSDFGCEIVHGKEGRVRPKDQDFCLSVLDYATSESTKTRAMNELANRVCRVMCVGNDDDINSLAREMESKRETFMQQWAGDASGSNWEGAPEDRFFMALIALLDDGFSNPPQHLSQAYTNAYKRLVDILVKEVGSMSTPTSEKVLQSFVNWERDLRKTSFDGSWDPNPNDLLGSWALGSDYTILGLEPGSDDAAYSDKELAITLKEGGRVEISPRVGVGLAWRLDPGPTHLDTLFFEMISNVDKEEGLLLSYTGYIDRGARIEARFSKRSIKMTGRLTKNTAKGIPQTSARFSMRLVERKN